MENKQKFERKYKKTAQQRDKYISENKSLQDTIESY